ncbi:MAG TPA: tetraacyldisaccharide 4'-kinase [Methylomirabilota bacterium]|nr:tetraacyldisaccharide 4'-kinase [Methylomirabilota bacterium]
MTRSSASVRLARRWDEGFSPGPALVLGALAGGYRGLLGARQWLYDRGVLRSRALPCAVVSVGNLTVGGTGKTPAVELAVRTLVDLGHRPAVVSRGYRRQSRGVQVVADTASIRLDPEDAGDEPFLLARRLPRVPVIVGANRYEAARLAVQRFRATAVVLDDGFQHRTLAKDLEVVMTRARNPWGNGQLLPGGPLREPLAALARAHLIVATEARSAVDLEEVQAAARRWAPGVPVLSARYAPVECWEAERMQTRPLTSLNGARLLAFAGIASPRGFGTTLNELGVAVLDQVSFPDHHWYTLEDLRELNVRARQLGAEALITTEKDWVRLRRLSRPERALYILSVQLELLAGDDLWRAAFARTCART